MRDVNIELDDHEQLVSKMRSVYDIDRQRQQVRDDYHAAMGKLDIWRDALMADIHEAPPEAVHVARQEAKRLEREQGQ